MSKPAKWSLEGDAPEPMRWEDPKPLTKEQAERLNPSDTHTGTDPHGRAVGPAEDHTKPKLDSEGRTVPEAAAKRETAKKAAAKKAASRK